MTQLPLIDDAPLSVGELNRRARKLLERGLARLWVSGEVSNLARPASGHLYFTLKDADAQIRCAWFRQRQRSRGDGLENGEQMLVFGRVSLYEPRGDYQLIVERIEPAGEGALRRQFERLKKKLAAEGLFDDDGKRELPTLPKQIGVITSPSGAAVRDILSVLGRRFPAIPVIVYPAAVQGRDAPQQLVAALGKAYERDECDLLIVGRGGGSLEDLMAFNDERVARTIYDSPIPLISAVGHEVDVTIADFVADRRAPTPSGAAELAVPEQSEWQRNLMRAARQLENSLRRQLDDRQQTLDWLSRQLGSASPVGKLAEQSRQLTAIKRALAAAARHDLLRRRRAADRVSSRLWRASPQARVERLRLELRALRRRLLQSGNNTVVRLQNRLRLSARALHAVSPLATLERGYAVVVDATDGRLLTDAGRVAVGTDIEARLAHGRLIATVKEAQGDE